MKSARARANTGLQFSHLNDVDSSFNVSLPDKMSAAIPASCHFDSDTASRLAHRIAQAIAFQ
jgi:hypothetical protein